MRPAWSLPLRESQPTCYSCLVNYFARSGTAQPEVAVPIHRLNHAVLYVRDVERSVAFYGDVLGFTAVMAFPGAAFLRAPGSTNDHDLGLFEVGAAAGAPTAGRSTVGLY